jgi:hypothetical protein
VPVPHELFADLDEPVVAVLVGTTPGCAPDSYHHRTQCWVSRGQTGVHGRHVSTTVRTKVQISYNISTVSQARRLAGRLLCHNATLSWATSICKRAGVSRRHRSLGGRQEWMSLGNYCTSCSIQPQKYLRRDGIRMRQLRTNFLRDLRLSRLDEESVKLGVL